MAAAKGNKYAAGHVHGRPSDYHVDYCDQVIEHMAQGYSFESFAALLSVHKDTLYEWVKVHKEFSDAKRIGTEKCRLYFETQGLKGMNNKIPFFNDRIWRLNMINRFREEWTDRVDTDVTSKGEKIEKPDLTLLSDEQLAKLEEILTKANGG
jgi:hypothetical protein